MIDVIVPGTRWLNKGSKRVVVVTAVRHINNDVEVDYKYEASLGGSNLWKRGVTPTQTTTMSEWTRLFVPGTKAERKR